MNLMLEKYMFPLALDLRDNADQYQDPKESDVAEGTQTPVSILRKIWEKDQHEICKKILPRC